MAKQYVVFYYERVEFEGSMKKLKEWVNTAFSYENDPENHSVYQVVDFDLEDLVKLDSHSDNFYWATPWLTDYNVWKQQRRQIVQIVKPSQSDIIGYRKKKLEKETEMKKKKFTSGKSNENIFDKPWQYITAPTKGYLGGLVFTPCKGQYTYTSKQAIPEVKCFSYSGENTTIIEDKLWVPAQVNNVCYSYSTRIGYNLTRKMTIAYWTGGKNSNIIYIATAVCNPTDEFSKKEGRKVVDQHIREGKYIALPFSGDDPYNIIRGIYEFLEDEND